MPNILEIDSVIKSFGRNQLLTDIYLKCETGDIIGLLGRNGSGKSTLLKILFGAMPAERKFIRIDGKILNKPYLSKGEICFLPQHLLFPSGFSLNTIVKFYLQKEQIPVFFDDPLLCRLRNNQKSELSGGECRYAEIKLLLNTNVKFLLLDEPFNGLSPLLIEAVKKMIQQHSRHKGIILTDHDYRNVLDVANRYYLLSDGGLKVIKESEQLVRWGYMSSSAANMLDF